MRYFIQFLDKTSMTVSQKDGEAIGRALSEGTAIIYQGAYINPRFISIIKPIKKGWFSSDFVDQQNRLELSEPDATKMIPAPIR